MKVSPSKQNAKFETTQSNGQRLPARSEIIQFISENSGHAGKREIAKAFNLKGDAKIWLRDLLRELIADGSIEKRGKSNVKSGSPPPIAVLQVFARDTDGGLLGHPIDWQDGAPPAIKIVVSRHGKQPTFGIGDQILAKVFRGKTGNRHEWTARLIRKIDKERKNILGVLRKSEKQQWFIEPIDRRNGEVKIADSEGFAFKQGDLVEVEVNQNRYGLKNGVIRNVLGEVDSEKAVSMIAVIAHDIPYIFPQEVLDQAETASTAELDGRDDWREIPFVTIDPSDAKDHDDAVYASPDDNPDNCGGFVLRVAIADVAYYVRSNTAMDREAFKRSNSVYFPDRVIPMLPERISNDLCSLREMVDRPALAVTMIFDKSGRKRQHKFHRVMMRSVAKLSYLQAQNAIDGNPDEKAAPLLEAVLRPLWQAYDVLKKGRNQRQPLELDLPERKINLDEDGRIKDVVTPLRLDAHKLIEEFMIQANVCAAETLRNNKQALLYRIHDQPSMAKQESLREFLNSMGLPLARGSELTPAKINTILQKVENTDRQELVNQVVLRSQSQAEYSPYNIGHFGLHLINYAHFTSPIRRYADLIVHRALIKALALGKDGLTDQEEANLEEIATQISINERRAMAAERETVDRLVAHYLADKIGAVFEARIAGVTKAGLFVSLQKLGADGFVPISSLRDDYYHFDETRHILVGERSNHGYQLGDVVTVKLLEALPIAGALRFEMQTAPRRLAPSSQSYHKSKKPGRRSRKR